MIRMKGNDYAACEMWETTLQVFNVNHASSLRALFLFLPPNLQKQEVQCQMLIATYNNILTISFEYGAKS